MGGARVPECPPGRVAADSTFMAQHDYQAAYAAARQSLMAADLTCAAEDYILQHGDNEGPTVEAATMQALAEAKQAARDCRHAEQGALAATKGTGRRLVSRLAQKDLETALEAERKAASCGARMAEAWCDCVHLQIAGPALRGPAQELLISPRPSGGLGTGEVAGDCEAEQRQAGLGGVEAQRVGPGA